MCIQNTINHIETTTVFSINPPPPFLEKNENNSKFDSLPFIESKLRRIFGTRINGEEEKRKERERERYGLQEERRAKKGEKEACVYHGLSSCRYALPRPSLIEFRSDLRSYSERTVAPLRPCSPLRSPLSSAPLRVAFIFAKKKDKWR